MTKLKKINLLLFIITVILLIYLIPKILIPLAKNKIHDYLEKSLRTEVILNRIGINLFTRSIILEDLRIENFLQVNQIVIKPELLPLLGKKLIISKISLDKPSVILHRLASGETNWDFLWQKGQSSEQYQPKNRFFVKELLIKDGIFHYIYEFSPERIATAESNGVFIYLKNYLSPISYIKDIPFYTRIKGRGNLPTEPKGIITFSGNANLGIPSPSLFRPRPAGAPVRSTGRGAPGTHPDVVPEVDRARGKSFHGDISMDNISLTYFNSFYPENSQIQVINGRFSLQTHAECLYNHLRAEPNVTVRDLQLKLTQDYETGDVFELPVMLVVDFFDIYKEELKFTFEVSGTLSDPDFQLEHVVAQKVSEVIGESIVRTIATSPTLVAKLGDKLVAIADKLKELGLDIGKGAGKAIKQLEKPVKELIKGLKGQ